MSDLTQALASYVPAMVLRSLASGGLNGAAPPVERFPAALLFADISGSTALAERLAVRGSAGAEIFSRLLNASLGQVVDCVLARGGDVVKFAGDGLFAVWALGFGVADLPQATRHAAQCALDVQRALRAAPAFEGIALSMRIGVSAGEIMTLGVGSTASHVEYLVLGAPVAAVCRAEARAAPGEVMLTPEAWTLIRDRGTGDASADGTVRLTGLVPEAAVALRPVPVDASLEPQLRAYTPAAIVERLAARQGEWLAELRRISVLFAQLPDWNAHPDEAMARRAQELVGAIQAVLQRYQGTLSRVGMGADGPVVKADFGTPPWAHEDDAVRAVSAALEIRHELQRRGVRVALGIATGQAFCGAIGNTQRREYTVVGDVVNVGARLMQAADDAVLCDTSTHDASRGRFTFATLPAIAAKGKEDPIAVYQPRERRSLPAPTSRPVIGRYAERTRLRQHVAALEHGTSRVVVIEADAGMGKSCLIADLQRAAETRPVTVFVGAADAIEAATAYHAWQPIISHLFHLDEAGDDEANQRAHVLRQLTAWDIQMIGGLSTVELAPLLNAVLPIAIPETPSTAQMSDEARADNTHDLLLQIMQRVAETRPLLVIIEDAHWLDSPSWTLVRLASQKVRPLLLVLATRPPSEPQPAEYRRVQQSEMTDLIRLQPLTQDETVALVCERLGATSLSEPVAAFIAARGGGHPYFSEEVAYALRDAGLVTTVGGVCRIVAGAGADHTLPIPDTLRGVITSRVDRLTARQGLALKIGSIIGRSFAVATLTDVHPIATDRAYIPEDLQTLAQLDLVHADLTAPEPTYVFKHAITQDVTYHLMSFAQRQQLHQTVGEWYERTYRQHLSPYYPLVAHHFSRAVDLERPDPLLLARAIDAVEHAGEQAVQRYANEETLQFFQDALRLQPRSGSDVDDSRRARWYRHLADAAYRLGRVPDAIEHALQALQCFGQPFPRHRLRRHLGIAQEVGRQVMHRLLGPYLSGRLRGSAREASLDAAHLYELLGLMWFVTLDGIPAILANLRALNLAERAGPAPELATSSAMVGLLVGVMIGPQYGEHYFQQGLAAARQLGDRYGYGRIVHTQALVYAGQTRWAESEAAFREALATFEETADARWRDIERLAIGTLQYFHRRYADSHRTYLQASVSARERGDVQAQAWSYVGIGSCLLVEGRSAEAIEVFDDMETWMANNFAHLGDRSSELSVHAMRGAAGLRLGQLDVALREVEITASMIEEVPALSVVALPGFTYGAEVPLRLWESQYHEQQRVQRVAVRGMRNLQKYARLYPLGRPSAKLWYGLLCWLRGETRRAHDAWRAALDLARAHDMPHEEGLAHYEFGRHLPVGDPDRLRHLQQAIDIFTTFELEYERAAAEGAIQDSSRQSAV